MRVGARQLELLITLATPNRLLVIGDKVSDALVRRGLLMEREKRCGIGITAAWLRTLAEAMERGDVVAAIERMKKRAAVRRERRRRKSADL